MGRTRAWRRARRASTIARRKRVASSIKWTTRHDGVLAKHNMSCSCGMCDANHPMKVRRREPSAREAAARKSAEWKISESATS